MVVTKSLIQRSAFIQSVARNVWSRTLATSFHTQICKSQYTISQPSLKLLQQPHTIKQLVPLCRASSTQTGKFEVLNVQDEDDFKKRVLESDKPVIVDFHASWCGPCKILGPRLEKLLSEGDQDVVFAKVDIDENSDLAMEYGVRSVPTVLAMKGGEVQNQFVGVIDEDQIQSFVDKLVVS